MAVEQQKYRANLLLLSGFALITPVGRLVIEIIENENFHFNIRFVIVFIVAGLLAYVGLLFLIKGDEKLEGK